MKINKEVLKQQIKLCSQTVDQLNEMSTEKADLMEGVVRVLEKLAWSSREGGFKYVTNVKITWE